MNLEVASDVGSLTSGTPSMHLASSEVVPICSDLSNDPDLADLIALFVEELPARCTAMEQALAMRDWALLRTLAHQLKGAVGSYGFCALMPYLVNLESAANSPSDTRAAADALQALIKIAGRVRAGF